MSSRFWWQSAEYATHAGLLRFDSVQHMMVLLRDFDLLETKAEMQRYLLLKISDSLSWWQTAIMEQLGERER